MFYIKMSENYIVVSRGTMGLAALLTEHFVLHRWGLKVVAFETFK